MPTSQPEPGAPQAFEALLAPILDAAYGAAAAMTRNPSDAEDLVQQAALQAFRAFGSFRPGSNFRAWFFRILTNCFYSEYRKRRHHSETIDLDDAGDLHLFEKTREAGLLGGDDPARALLSRMDTEQILRAIETLPEEFRVVSALYFVQDFSYQEIADMLACPIGTVRSRLHRGRKMLQKALWHVAEEHGIVAALRAERA